MKHGEHIVLQRFVRSTISDARRPDGLHAVGTVIVNLMVVGAFKIPTESHAILFLSLQEPTSSPVHGYGWLLVTFAGPHLTAAIQSLNSLGCLLFVYAVRYGKAIIVVPMVNILFPLVTIVLSLSVGP